MVRSLAPKLQITKLTQMPTPTAQGRARRDDPPVFHQAPVLNTPKGVTENLEKAQTNAMGVSHKGSVFNMFIAAKSGGVASSPSNPPKPPKSSSAAGGPPPPPPGGPGPVSDDDAGPTNA